MKSVGTFLRRALRIKSRAIDFFGYRNRVVSRILLGIGPKSSYGLGGLDQLLIGYISKKRGFFIELGANDGVAQSNTLILELVFGWSGVLVEPVSDSFRKLQKNRNSRRNYLANVACVSFSFEGEHVSLALSNLMSSPLIPSNDLDVRAHVLGKGVGGPLPTELVEARTLTAVLEEAKAPHEIDLLSLDVEGGEMEVLEGIDFLSYRIDWILVESRSPRDVSNLLQAHGYQLVKRLTHHDFLYRLGR